VAIIFTPIIIAKASGKLRDGLFSLLENQPSIIIIDIVQDEISLFDQLDHLSENCIILMDIDLFENNTFPILNRIKTNYPHTNSILLVNTFNQKKSANVAGFNHILIKGFNVNDLLLLIEQVKTSESINNDAIGTNQELRV
jgi:DNA-binding NarL/FixJ family response regulator